MATIGDVARVMLLLRARASRYSPGLPFGWLAIDEEMSVVAMEERERQGSTCVRKVLVPYSWSACPARVGAAPAPPP